MANLAPSLSLDFAQALEDGLQLQAQRAALLSLLATPETLTQREPEYLVELRYVTRNDSYAEILRPKIVSPEHVRYRAHYRGKFQP